MAERILKQRAMMRELIDQFGTDREKIVAAYAVAERNGTVQRWSNQDAISPENYARDLWRNGFRENDPWIARHMIARGITLPEKAVPHE